MSYTWYWPWLLLSSNLTRRLIIIKHMNIALCQCIFSSHTGDLTVVVAGTSRTVIHQNYSAHIVLHSHEKSAQILSIHLSFLFRFKVWITVSNPILIQLFWQKLNTHHVIIGFSTQYCSWPIIGRCLHKFGPNSASIILRHKYSVFLLNSNYDKPGRYYLSSTGSRQTYS